MLAHDETVSDAAYAVEYQSVPQFTREDGRLFGTPRLVALWLQDGLIAQGRRNRRSRLTGPAPKRTR